MADAAKPDATAAANKTVPASSAALDASSDSVDTSSGVVPASSGAIDGPFDAVSQTLSRGKDSIVEPDEADLFNRAELAQLSGVDPFVVDLVIDAGLLVPVQKRVQGDVPTRSGSQRSAASSVDDVSSPADCGSSLVDDVSSPADCGSSLVDGGFRSVELFGPDGVDMLRAARTLVKEGVTVEELAALAIRHSANVEAVIDDAIDLFQHHANQRGSDISDLVDSVQRLVPVATQLVAGHFERTLTTRALARLGDASARSGTDAILVITRLLPERVDPLAFFNAIDALQHRSLWLCPSAGMGLAAEGVVEAIEPSGTDRFSSASAARVLMEARVRCESPDNAPAPVLLGGFSFAPTNETPAIPLTDEASVSVSPANEASTPTISDEVSVTDSRSDEALVSVFCSDEASITIPDEASGPPNPPRWTGFGDCRLVLAQTTVIDRPDGTWVQVAARLKPDQDEAAIRADLDRRLATVRDTSFPTPSAMTTSAVTSEAFPASTSSVVSEAFPAPTSSVVSEAFSAPTSAVATDLSAAEVALTAGHTATERSPSAGAAISSPPKMSPKDLARRIRSVGLEADDSYLDLVTAAIAAIQQGELHKVVVSRAVDLDIDLITSGVLGVVLSQLHEGNPNCAVFAFSAATTDPTSAATKGPSTVFFGATPEELVTLNGPRLHTTALAGTAARGSTADEDTQLAAELMASPKNQSEHRFVVNGITDALTGLGLVDPAPSEPGLLRLARLQHLSTPITARVQRRRSGMNDIDVLRVAGVLHPTPAVGGTPTDAALTFIANNEPFSRGWYAAPVGWCDLEGNGELRVALRCGLAASGHLRLFAGAGIVADSEPALELQETTMKLQALVDAIAGSTDSGVGRTRPNGCKE